MPEQLSGRVGVVVATSVSHEYQR
jgi:hypothetical protein